MSKANHPGAGAIGLFDSGLGGLTVLRSCKDYLPHGRFIYLGDTARTPYGPKGPETIRRYSRECAQFLINQQVKLIVVACNTASSYALSFLKESFACPIIGTIAPAVNAALSVTRNRRIGIIGTDATINSRAYEKEIFEKDPTAEVFSFACPLFVPLVEQGMCSGEIVDKIIELYLRPLREREVDTVILGCTHYPLLTDAIQKYLGDSVNLICCADEIAKEVTAICDSSSTQSGNVQFFVTDETQRFSKLASFFLGEQGLAATKVGIDSL